MSILCFPRSREMMMAHVERAVDRIRAQLIECAARDDWSDRSICQLTETIRGCVRQISAARPCAPSSPRPRLSRPALRAVVRYVRNRLDTKLMVEDMAAAAGMERHVFERTFKERTGLTPYEYVIRCRMRRAQRLLACSELSLVEIALDVGFACQSHFTTMFRKRTGTTPAAYRMSARRYGLPRMTTPVGSELPRYGASRSAISAARRL